MERVDIVISGSVATGKTYIQEALKAYFKDIDLYPEFIYEDGIALEILRRRFRNECSAMTLQSFILDKWTQLSKKKRTKRIAIYERLPDDAIEVFSKMSLNANEYKLHENWLEHTPILSYKDMKANNTIWVIYENSFEKPITKLIEMIDSYSHNYRYIVIEIHSKSSYDNYKHRNRDGEFYTPEELTALYEAYLVYMKNKREEIGCLVVEM